MEMLTAVSCRRDKKETDAMTQGEIKRARVNQDIYSLEKYRKPGILRDFFCTWRNQRALMEFYLILGEFLKISL